MRILDRFFKGMKNKKTENQNQNEANIDKRELNKNEFIATLQKQVFQKRNRAIVETAIRSGDGMGMNTKIEE